MTGKTAISGIIEQFQQRYADTYRTAIAKEGGGGGRFLILTEKQRSEMEIDLLNEIVPTDADVLIDIIIAHPALFTEQLPTRGLFECSPLNLVRYGIMVRAQTTVVDVRRKLEADIFKALDAGKLHDKVKEAVELLRTGPLKLRAEITAAVASLNQFQANRDRYALDNLITDADALAPLLRVVDFTDSAVELEAIIQYARANLHEILAA